MSFFKDAKDYDQSLVGRQKRIIGWNHPKETCAKISAKAKLRKHSEETKQKISNIVKGRMHSDESKAKISAAMKNRIVSKETRQKMSEANKGRASGVCNVYVYNTPYGTFDSAKKIQDITGLSPHRIRKKCDNTNLYPDWSRTLVENRSKNLTK